MIIFSYMKFENFWPSRGSIKKIIRNSRLENVFCEAYICQNILYEIHKELWKPINKNIKNLIKRDRRFEHAFHQRQSYDKRAQRNTFSKDLKIQLQWVLIPTCYTESSGFSKFSSTSPNLAKLAKVQWKLTGVWWAKHESATSYIKIMKLIKCDEVLFLNICLDE